jgi:hypothetical protein
MKRSVLKCAGSILVLLALVMAGCASSPAEKKSEGQILYEKGELDSAIAVCTEAIQANADDYDAYYYRGRA